MRMLCVCVCVDCLTSTNIWAISKTIWVVYNLFLGHLKHHDWTKDSQHALTKNLWNFLDLFCLQDSEKPTPKPQSNLFNYNASKNYINPVTATIIYSQRRYNYQHFHYISIMKTNRTLAYIYSAKLLLTLILPFYIERSLYLP